jgi:hypothetical protein
MRTSKKSFRPGFDAMETRALLSGFAPTNTAIASPDRDTPYYFGAVQPTNNQPASADRDTPYYFGNPPTNTSVASADRDTPYYFGNPPTNNQPASADRDTPYYFGTSGQSSATSSTSQPSGAALEQLVGVLKGSYNLKKTAEGVKVRMTGTSKLDGLGTVEFVAVGTGKSARDAFHNLTLLLKTSEGSLKVRINPNDGAPQGHDQATVVKGTGAYSEVSEINDWVKITYTSPSTGKVRLAFPKPAIVA